MGVSRGEPLLLGYDARVEPPEWNEGRRRRFLFRPDVPQPVSIDEDVWPSVFGLRSDLRPPYTGPYCHLWEDLGHLEEVVGAAGDVARNTRIVAFGVFTSACTPGERTALDDQIRGVYPDGRPGESLEVIADPSSVQEGWSFLGYDVADLWGLSGLMNAGFLPGREDVDALRAEWGPRLNELHLFEDLADAARFKDFSNLRVSEHAPFFVDGIWRVR